MADIGGGVSSVSLLTNYIWRIAEPLTLLSTSDCSSMDNEDDVNGMRSSFLVEHRRVVSANSRIEGLNRGRGISRHEEASNYD